jgi:hypothetical protein
MYRIYMPVDLVLAISHNRLVRERELKRQKQPQKQMQTNKESNGVMFCDNNSKDNDTNKNKDKTCLEIFRIW